MKRISFLFIILTFCSQFIYAIEYSPWYGDEKLFETRHAVIYRHVPCIHTSTGKTRYTSNDLFSEHTLLFVPTADWSAEVELVTAETGQRSWGFDNVKLAGKHLFYNDIVGDWVSLSVGGSIGRASHIALQDITSFHHGEWEYEGHVSIGKEFSCEEFWQYRVWAVGAIGIANRGSPWIKADVHLEKNWCDCYQAAFFTRTLLGLGERSIVFPIEPISSFPGYGSIKHRSLDVGASFTYQFCFGDLTAEYSYRPWARQFPTETHTALLRLTLYFSPADVPLAHHLGRYWPSPLE